MSRDYRIWVGMAGCSPHENERALAWEKRLHWPMIVVALLSVPSFYLETFEHDPLLFTVGSAISVLIVIAFIVELIVMLALVENRARYIKRNWLSVAMVVGFAVSLVDFGAELAPLLRLVRLVVVGGLLLRGVHTMKTLLSADALPYVLTLGGVLLLLAGAGFYWLEPTVQSYGEGLWLAFVTGATVGYGDFVPTTPTSRFFAATMVLVGYAILSVVTASIAAMFIGEDERALRRELHRDVKILREEIGQLRDELRQALAQRNAREPTSRSDKSEQ